MPNFERVDQELEDVRMGLDLSLAGLGLGVLMVGVVVFDILPNGWGVYGEETWEVLSLGVLFMSGVAVAGTRIMLSYARRVVRGFRGFGKPNRRKVVVEDEKQE
jgi:hypothetical protein